MAYAVIDTETSGLFDFNKPADAEGQPRMASLAIISLSDSLEVEGVYHRLIRPEGWEMDPEGEAVKVNGLTTERLMAEGVPVAEALAAYSQAVKEGRIVVAFNAQYDTKILRGELRRAGLPDLFEATKNICVMRGLTDVCQVPKASGKGWKFPKLAEAMAHFGLPSNGAHDAMADAHSCLALFRQMVALDLVPEAKVHYAKARPEPDNPRAVPGGNNPPVSPYEAVKSRIDDLYTEARNWLDGEPVTTAALADGVKRLEATLKDAIKEADEARKAENAPFDAGKAEVQARYNLLIADTKTMQGTATKALAACKEALKPWLIEQQRVKDEAARQAREEAERIAAQARAAREAADLANLAERERVQQAEDEAIKAAHIAQAAQKAITVKTGLRVTYRAVLRPDDPFADGPSPLQQALSHIWKHDKDGLREFAQAWADRAVRDAGKSAAGMTIPGFVVEEVKDVR